jgi:outer membrane protein
MNLRFFRQTLAAACTAACLGGGSLFWPLPEARSENPAELTLDAAVTIALAGNPLIRLSASGREAADARVSQAQAGWMPSLQFNETYTHSNNPVAVFGTLLEQGRFGSQNFQIDALNDPPSIDNFRTSVTLRQPLFDQLQTPSRVAQARIGRQQADLQSESVRQQIRFETIRAYFGILVARARKTVAEDAVRMAEADRKQIQDRFEKGLIVQSDLLALEVQVADFRQQEIETGGDVVVAYAGLNTVLGLPPETPQRVIGDLSEKKFEIPAQDELLRIALDQRPDHRRAGLAVDMRKESVRERKGEYLPRVDLMASYGGSAQNLKHGSSDYTLGASLSLNIFDGGRQGRLREARAAESAAEAERHHSANQIRLEVVRACQQFISARERVGVAARAIDQAAETLRIVRNRYHVGLTTITEVLRAENALVRARLNQVMARYEHYVSYAGVLLATGRLTDVGPFSS